MGRRQTLVIFLVAIVGCSTGGVPTDWGLLEVDDTQLEIVAVIGSSDCNALDTVLVEEGDESVDIAVTISESRRPMGCGQGDLFVENISVDLSAPLGDRPLTGCLLGDEEYFRPDSSDVNSRRESCTEVVTWR